MLSRTGSAAASSPGVLSPTGRVAAAAVAAAAVVRGAVVPCGAAVVRGAVVLGGAVVVCGASSESVWRVVGECDAVLPGLMAGVPFCRAAA